MKEWSNEVRVDDNQPRELAGMVLTEEQRIPIMMLMSKLYLIPKYHIIYGLIRTRQDLLSTPQSGGKNVKTCRWDHR